MFVTSEAAVQMW